MSFRLAVLLSVSGLVACSHNASVAVKAPLGAEQRTESASEAATKPTPLENALQPPSAPEPAGNPVEETRPNEREGNAGPSAEQASSDNDLGTMQRIRQAAMADSSL
jgi:hypothetical protein